MQVVFSSAQANAARLQAAAGEEAAEAASPARDGSARRTEALESVATPRAASRAGGGGGGGGGGAGAGGGSARGGAAEDEAEIVRSDTPGRTTFSRTPPGSAGAVRPIWSL